MIPTSFLIVLIIFESLFNFSNCAHQEFDRAITMTCQAQTQPQYVKERGGDENFSHENIVSKVELVRLYYVSSGKLYTLTLGKNDLNTNNQFSIDGHVCGIVALCDEEMSVTIDGQEFDRIRMNEDGTFSLRNFRRLKLDELTLPGCGQAYDKKATSGSGPNREKESFLPGAYSFFPRITGDSVSQDPQFSIDLEEEGKAYEMVVRQNDFYHAFRTISLNPACQERILTFRYLGPSPSEQSSDCEARLQAISQGISCVESTFDVHLVNNVNIIDFEDIDDAVSCDGRNDIWIYAQAFRKEPLDELKTIAEHESLHILVDRNDLTRDSGVRQLFADLKGYDDFSYERFMLVMGGVIPNTGKIGQCDHDNVFFAFINERNFLKGMKGGHPQNDLDEFCASFLHSLMFIDRIEQNLEHPLTFPGVKNNTRYLTPEEKAAILDNYVRTLEALTRAIPEKSGTSTMDHVMGFLETNLKKVENLRDKWHTEHRGGNA